MKIGIVGLGRISVVHKECYIKLKEKLKLIIACDIDENKCELFANDYYNQTKRKIFVKDGQK